MKTVKISNQEWMAENLNVSTFRNGDPILEIKSDEDWEVRRRTSPVGVFSDKTSMERILYAIFFL